MSPFYSEGRLSIIFLLSVYSAVIGDWRNHDDVITWKHFPRYWLFVPHKGQWRGALMFSLIYARINTWVNNRDAGDLRRHCAHYDAIVMIEGLTPLVIHISVSLMKSPCIHIYLIQCLNTLRPRQDGCLFADVILKCIFLNLNSWIPYKISWKYVAWRLIDNKPSMVQIMGCRRAGDNPIIWTINGIYIAKLGLDELGTVTEAIILATYTFQWLYLYCIRIYCILCFRNITLIVD